MQQKNTLKSWQMIVLLVILFGILMTMFMPVVQISKDNVVEATNEVEDKDDKGADLLEVFDGSDTTSKKAKKDAKENAKDKIKNYEKDEDVTISKVSPLKIMTTSLKKVLSKNSDDKDDKDDEKDSDSDKDDEKDSDSKDDKKDSKKKKEEKKESKKDSKKENKKKKDSKKKKDEKDKDEKKEDKEEDSKETTEEAFVVKSIKKMDSQYKTIQMLFFMIYILDVLLIICVLVCYFMHASKMIALVIGAIYGVISAACFGWFRFGITGTLGEKAYNVLKDADHLKKFGIDSLGKDDVKEGLARMFTHFYSLVPVIALGLAALTVLACVIFLFVGKPEPGYEEPGWEPGGMGWPDGPIGGVGNAPGGGFDIPGGAGGMNIPGGVSGVGASGGFGVPGGPGGAGVPDGPGELGVTIGLGNVPAPGEYAGGAAGPDVTVAHDPGQTQAGTITQAISIPAQTVPAGPAAQGNQPVTQKQAGKVKCTLGVSTGQGFTLPEDRKVIVGKNPQKANLVINHPNISNIHCSIRYNAAKNTYIIKDHSSNGTYVNGVRLQNGVAVEYPAGTILLLADGTNQITLG